MTFAECVKKEQETLKRTENGALAYNTLGDKVLDLFSTVGGMRDRTDEEIRDAFASAYEQSPLYCFLLAIYARDIREGGLGERRVGRIGLNYCAGKQPLFFRDNLETILNAGRADDLYSYLGVNKALDEAIWFFIEDTLIRDVTAMLRGCPVSLLAKWLKSINSSSAETRRLGRLTAKNLGQSYDSYRRLLSKLRRYIDVTEVKMSNNEWNKIDYPRVPSYAMKNYRNAFVLHDRKRFSQYKSQLTRGETKINASTLFPYDIVTAYKADHGYVDATEDAILEAQWESLPNYIEDGANVLIMADTSGSMYGRPMATALGLAAYFAERNKGPFADLFLTFSQEPRYVTLNRKLSLHARLEKVLDDADWGYNTNLDAAFHKILCTAVSNNLKQEDMPKALVVISDMEIDAGTKHTSFNMQTWKEDFSKYRYSLPKIVWWNVESEQNTFLSGTNEDCLFVSGQSASTFKNLIGAINGLDMTLFVKDTLASVCQKYTFDWENWNKF